MLLDARDLEDNQTLTFDVCIIGAGAAGITLALNLIDSGLSVCVLESGGLTIEDDTQALATGTMAGIQTWQLDRMRWRALGGSTQHWAGWCMPLGAEDFEVRDWIPLSGWPFTLADLTPYYERAQARLQLAGFLYDAAAVAQAEDLPLVETRGGAVTTRMFQYSAPVRMGNFYRDDITDAENVTTYLYANVTNMVLDDTLSRLARVECQTLSGVSFQVEADRFVLATGGIENARLLLACNGQIEEGLANSSDAVGRYFMEHPHYYASVAWLMGRAVDWSFYRRHRALVPLGDEPSEIDVRGVLSLTPEVRAAEGLPNFTAEIITSSFNAATGPYSPSAIRQLVRPADDQTVVLFNCRVEQTPDPASRVTLGASLDALGMPKVILNWRVRDEDNLAMRRAMEVMGADLAASGLGRLWTPRDDAGLAFTTQPGGHHMGTTRMSATANDGVVDSNCRSFDIENLYIAGSSVFPTGGSANPTLTIVALAERLADHLIEEED